MLHFGFSVKNELRKDSEAATGLASRGAEQVRHIHCCALWLHLAIARLKLRNVKQSGPTL